MTQSTGAGTPEEKKNFSITEKTVTIDAKLFEDMYYFLSSMRMMQECFEYMSKEKHTAIMDSITPIYDALNP